MDRTAQTARIAWLAAFVLPLILAVSLLAVKSAHAAYAGPSAVPLAVEEEFEAEDEDEFEAEETCLEAEEEFEAGELTEAELEAICEEGEDEDEGKSPMSGSAAPEECLLRSARVRAVALPKRNGLKLTIGYTTYKPVNVTVEIRKGSARIASVRRHLGRSGVLRIVKKLGKKKSAPKRVVVQIRVPSSPRYCVKFQTKKIRIS